MATAAMVEVRTLLMAAPLAATVGSLVRSIPAPQVDTAATLSLLVAMPLAALAAGSLTAAARSQWTVLPPVERQERVALMVAKSSSAATESTSTSTGVPDLHGGTNKSIHANRQRKCRWRF